MMFPIVLNAFVNGLISLLATVYIYNSSAKGLDVLTGNIPVHQSRRLDDLEGLNNLLRDTFVHLSETIFDIPPNAVVKLNDIHCGPMAVKSIQDSMQPEIRSRVRYNFEVLGLALDCSFFWTYVVKNDGLFAWRNEEKSGKGFISTRDNRFFVEFLLQTQTIEWENEDGENQQASPPVVASLRRCRVDVNVDTLNFENDEKNGRVVGLLNSMDRVLDNQFSRIIQRMLCQNLEERIKGNITEGLQSVLDFFEKNVFEGEDEVMYPIPEPETKPNQFLNLFNQTHMFGAWFHLGLDFLNHMFGLDFDSNTGINAFLRENYLDEDGIWGISIPNTLANETIQVLEIDELNMSASAQLTSLKIHGLDTFTGVHLNVTGPYVFHNHFALENLMVEASLTLAMKSDTKSTVSHQYDETQILRSRHDDTNITFQIPNIPLNVSVKVLLSDLDVNTSIYLPLDITQIEYVQVGTLLQPQNFLSCLLATLPTLRIQQVQMTMSDYQIMDISGVIAPGIDKIILNLLRNAATLYGDFLDPDVVAKFMERFIPPTFNNATNTYKRTHTCPVSCIK